MFHICISEVAHENLQHFNVVVCLNSVVIEIAYSKLELGDFTYAEITAFPYANESEFQCNAPWWESRAFSTE